MTDIMNSPAVKQVMKQPGHVSADGAAQAQGEQPIRAAVVRAAELARDAESNARTRQHAKGKMTARERLGLLLDTGSFEEIGRFRGGDINGGKAGSAVITRPFFTSVWISSSLAITSSIVAIIPPSLRRYVRGGLAS